MVLRSPLITTKLYIPAAPPDLVLRPRLIERLNEALSSKLILISAPAGFGKTTLLSQWFQQLTVGPRPDAIGAETLPAGPPGISAQVAWVSLDESDNDPARFWAYVIAALETVASGTGQQVLARLRAPQLPPLEAMLALLLNDVATIQDTDLFLVLDDYHIIELQAIHDSLAFFIEHLPPRTHVIIATRAEPPLPLPRLRVRRQLAELHTAELRFTPDEVAVFLNQVMGLELSEVDVASLEARTEGWIAGLQLAAISLKGHPDVSGFVAAFSGSHHYVLDYLAEEVFQQQPKQVQTFLLQTAILNRMNAPLCNAVTKQTDSQDMLAHLLQQNLFIVPLDNQRHWFRYHRLFTDLLRHYFRQSPLSTETAELHRRAAGWYSQQGMIAEAINHLLAAEDFEQAGQLIEQTMEAMFTHGEMVALRRWLEAFPSAQLQARPALGTAYAWVLFFAGELPAAAQHLEEAERGLVTAGLSQAERRTMQAITHALQAQFALLHGEIEQAIQISQQALADLPQQALILRSIVALNLGTAHWLNGDPQAADQIMIETAAVDQTGADTATILIATTNLAEMQTIRGQLSQAEQLYRRVLQLATTEQEYHLSGYVGRSYVGLSGILYEWNKLDAAEAFLNKGLELGRQSGDMHTILGAHLNLVWLHQARGQVEQAQDMLQQVMQLTPGFGPGFVPAIINTFQVRLWLAQGNLTAATDWVRKANLSQNDVLDEAREFEYIVLTRVLLAQNKAEVAATLLGRLLEMANSARHTRSTIEILILQALAYQAQRQTEPALAALQQALALAEPENHLRIFVDEAAPLANLLRQFTARRRQTESDPLPSTGYLQKLFAAFALGPMPSLAGNETRTAEALVEPLTRRELEVLQLIAAGLSNKEIAEQLIIATSTVKTHTKHIYSKLGVKSRLQAVAKADSLNLLQLQQQPP